MEVIPGIFISIALAAIVLYPAVCAVLFLFRVITAGPGKQYTSRPVTVGIFLSLLAIAILRQGNRPVNIEFLYIATVTPGIAATVIGTPIDLIRNRFKKPVIQSATESPPS